MDNKLVSKEIKIYPMITASSLLAA